MNLTEKNILFLGDSITQGVGHHHTTKVTSLCLPVYPVPM